MKNIFLSALLVLLVVVTTTLAGCTTYGEAGISGGYLETQITPREYSISFDGNGYTSRDRVDDFNRLRVAEKALELGYSHFLVVSKSRKKPSPATFRTTYHVRYLRHAKDIPAEALDEFKDAIFDAKEVYNTLAQKYGMKPR